MRLLVFCVLAMVTISTTYGWGYPPGTFLSKAKLSALKTQIIAGFDRKLASWLRRHGNRLSAIQKKTLYFVNRRYMQTHWRSYMKFVRNQMKLLGRAETTADYNRVGAAIGKRIPLEITYSFLVRRNLIPKWKPYMARLMARRPGDIPTSRG
uniref:Egg-lysin n=1 Tax=Haliotis iris TaxID=36096 RepID=Q25075_HALIR|nr:lysin [Haliotis iris]